MDLQLKGRRALVSGSSAGIGVAIAHHLAAEGAAVVVHGRDVERTERVAQQIRDTGAEVAVAIGDLTTEEGAGSVAASAVAAFGGIDILVNNAGGAHEGAASWFDTPIDAILASYESNTVAAIRLIRSLAPAMKERGWGRIVNIATAAAVTPTSGQPDYGPSKAAMINMSLGLSKALRSSGVTSNCVSPGMVRTQGLNTYLTEFADQRGLDSVAEAESVMLKGIGQTVGRVGEVDDIAYMVTMLASPRSDFVNGTNVHVDGGISPSVN
ncbi:SDR family NAD(P)-dependent oxidoreductase [Janibacter limosus]|uniref:SDR family NAD(P)-dependent oxidoreductase n=1 Tax=Janibacter limosus TaxID=53458 RepID=UPI000833EEC4|nr:SDR family oxidoreductase [Janibacter limosus]